MAPILQLVLCLTASAFFVSCGNGKATRDLDAESARSNARMRELQRELDDLEDRYHSLHDDYSLSTEVMTLLLNRMTNRVSTIQAEIRESTNAIAEAKKAIKRETEKDAERSKQIEEAKKRGIEVPQEWCDHNAIYELSKQVMVLEKKVKSNRTILDELSPVVGQLSKIVPKSRHNGEQDSTPDASPGRSFQR